MTDKIKYEKGKVFLMLKASFIGYLLFLIVGIIIGGIVGIFFFAGIYMLVIEIYNWIASSQIINIWDGWLLVIILSTISFIILNIINISRKSEKGLNYIKDNIMTFGMFLRELRQLFLVSSIFIAIKMATQLFTYEIDGYEFEYALGFIFHLVLFLCCILVENKKDGDSSIMLVTEKQVSNGAKARYKNIYNGVIEYSHKDETYYFKYKYRGKDKIIELERGNSYDDIELIIEDNNRGQY